METGSVIYYEHGSVTSPIGVGPVTERRPSVPE